MRNPEDRLIFQKIMIPVDLAHKDDLKKSLACAGDLAKHYGAEVVYVGVSSTLPSSIAHNPSEFTAKMDAFADEQAKAHGISASAMVQTSADPKIDIDSVLLDAIKTSGADLVIMQSHLPKLTDYIWPSNGGRIAEHSTITVMVVRG